MHRIVLIFCFLSFIISGCAASTFRVLDAETKKPIEGAVALAMWTKSRGLPGLSYRYTSKAVEAVSDAQGLLTFKWSQYTPHIKIYKPGYVGWDSTLIYLGPHKKNKTLPIYKSREGFTMRDQDIYLEAWKDEYTFISHYFHIVTHPDIYEAGLKRSKYEKSIEYEDPLRSQERRVLSK